MTVNPDLTRAVDEMRRDREALTRLIAALSLDDLGRSRPGGWTVRRVIEHVIESEATYAKVLGHLCGCESGTLPARDAATAHEAIEKLSATRDAALSMVAGVDDETLYRLVQLGHEEYSPLSTLENIALHDREHHDQIRELITDTQRWAEPAARQKPSIASARSLLPAIERLRYVGKVIIRPAEAGDLPRLTEIYNYYVVETAITFDLDPFSVEQRLEWFGHYAATGRHRMLVAESAGRVLGYAYTSQFRVKRAYDTTVEMTVSCAPEAVGFGIGQRLYEHLFPAIAGEDIHMAVAAITMPNAGSCALHERFGFTRTAVLREVGRKFDRYWDVAWYMRQMDA